MGKLKISNVVIVMAIFALASVVASSMAYSSSHTGSSFKGEIKDPAKVSQLNVRIVQSGTIEIDAKTLSSISVNLTAPQTTDVQRVETLGNHIPSKYDDTVLNIYQENPSLPFTYSVQSLATVKATHTYDLPMSYSVPDDVKEFLEPTPGIQSDYPEFRKIAEDATKTAETDFERIAMLAAWVNDYVTYDLRYGDKNYDAIWTLENKAGVCSEYTSLFIALARSIGVPARYVSAYAYGQYGWEAHAYAEVYLGKWVPVDPLWLQAGSLDATHIRFSVNNDNQVANNVVAQGRFINSIDWVKDDTDIKVLTYQEEAEVSAYELIKTSEEYGPGDKGIIILRFKPDEYKIIQAFLAPCVGDVNGDGETDSIVDVNEKKRNVILEPGKEAFVYWEFETSKNLPKNMIYTCPVTMNSRLLETKSIELKINTADFREENEVAIDAELSNDIINKGSSESVEFTVSRVSGNSPITVGVLGGGEEKTFTYAGKDDKKYSFIFEPNALGTQEVLIYSSTGTLVSVPYVVQDRGDVYFSRVDSPDVLELGTKSKAIFTITNQKTSPQSLKVFVTVDGTESLQQIVVDNNYGLLVPLEFSSIGEKTINVELQAAGIDIQKSTIVEVYSEPELSITKAIWDKESQDAKITIVSKNSPAKNVVVSVNDLSETIPKLDDSETIVLKTAKGKTTAKISFEDLGGKKYSVEQQINIRTPNLFAAIIDFFRGLFS